MGTVINAKFGGDGQKRFDEVVRFNEEFNRQIDSLPIDGFLSVEFENSDGKGLFVKFSKEEAGELVQEATLHGHTVEDFLRNQALGVKMEKSPFARKHLLETVNRLLGEQSQDFLEYKNAILEFEKVNPSPVHELELRRTQKNIDEFIKLGKEAQAKLGDLDL